MSLRSTRIRLFLTCWLVFCLHFATDFVREHYLVLAIVEDHSFHLDKYIGLHADIFNVPGRGATMAANPGASMIAAVPYFLLHPIADQISAKYSKQTTPNENATYQHPIHARAEFYKLVHERNLEIKFGLVGIITMFFCMAPLTALCVVVMFQALQRSGFSYKESLTFSFVFAFGTPIFFRTGYLSHNWMLGIFVFIAFVSLWQQPTMRKSAGAGVLCGLAFLCDYSGLIPLIFLAAYCWIKQGHKHFLAFICGAFPAIALLWFYQWQCFGNPFSPPQHYMPPGNPYATMGYHGFAGFSPQLLWTLLFDARVGIFIAAPILVLAFFPQHRIPARETRFSWILFAAMLLFFACVRYTQLQWITGIRYLTPTIPFLFLPVAAVLARLPQNLCSVFSCISIVISWCMAMVRPDEGVTILQSMEAVLIRGPQLPWITTLSRMSVQYVPGWLLTPWPYFLICATCVLAVWKFKS
ncbi:MAG: hypothetical protein C5B54_11120 [Acidobacteria bacterium]|nr:MAG: hypothetical protein C5B54_11120 [Acidobacteriota bacterium]